MGKDFYENFYYELMIKNYGIDQLGNFKNDGFKIDLTNLEKYKQENAEVIATFINPKTNEQCNKQDTRVLIYPKEPFGKTDYELKLELSCGFPEK